MSQYSEFGTLFGLFDEGGKNIELKQDTKNMEREKRRIQGAYDKWFGSPALKNWSSAVQNTDLGVLRTYGTPGSELGGKRLVKATTPAVKRVVSEMKKLIKKDPEVRLFRNRKDGSLLVVGQYCGATGPEHFALFSKQGRLIERFVIDV